MTGFATVDELEVLWRPLQANEIERAEKLLEIVSDTLRHYAKNANKDLDSMLEDDKVYESVVKSVTIDIVSRTLMTSTNREPMMNESQSALGYSWSGTFLVPGGGLFIKDSELKRLGLKKPRYGAIDIYGTDKRDRNNTN